MGDDSVEQVRAGTSSAPAGQDPHHERLWRVLAPGGTAEIVVPPPMGRAPSRTDQRLVLEQPQLPLLRGWQLVPRTLRARYGSAPSSAPSASGQTSVMDALTIVLEAVKP